MDHGFNISWSRCDWKLITILVLFFAFFVFQIGNSAMTGNKIRHLTNWTDMVYVITFYCIAVEYFLLDNRFGVVTKIVFPVTFSQSWFVAAAMLALQLQDDEILDEAAESFGEGAVWVANIFIHYIMMFISIVLLVFLFKKDELRNVPNQTVFNTYIITTPLLLCSIYTVWYNLSTQYPGNLDFLVIMFCGSGAAILASSLYVVYLQHPSLNIFSHS